MHAVSLSRAVSKITLVNMLLTVAGFITAPIIGRALGADGRGQLAAIIATITLLQPVLGLGLGIFAAREVAAGRSVGELLGTLVPLTVGLAAVGMVGGWFIAGPLSEGDETVRTFLRIGFLLAPVSLIAGVLQAILTGQQRWDRLLLARAIPTILAVVAIPVLVALDELNVASAATVAIVGGVASILPTLHLLAHGWRPRWDRGELGRALSFGSRAWAGGFANIANLRLDQVLMISLTTDRQLGLYAVAVTIATAPSVLPGAVAGPLLARVSAGDRGLAARATRTTLMLVAVAHVVIGALSVPVVLVLFGDQFVGAIAMVWALLVAGLPLAGGILLNHALSADGAPGRTAMAQFVGLVVTVPLLLVLVPEYGGRGAALASIAAYGASFLVLARATIRRGLARNARDLLVVRRDDLAWLCMTVRQWWSELRSTRGSQG